jgi:hypothetical protein
MTPRWICVLLLLLLSLPSSGLPSTVYPSLSSFTLRQTGVEESPEARARLIESLNAGAEEKPEGMDRRELLQRLAAGAAVSTLQSAQFLEGELERYLGAPAVLPNVRQAADLLLKLLENASLVVEGKMKRFFAKPLQVLVSEEGLERMHHYRRVSQQPEKPRSDYPDYSVDKFLSPLRERIQRLDAWIERLESKDPAALRMDPSQEMETFGPLAAIGRMRSGKGHSESQEVSEVFLGMRQFDLEISQRYLKELMQTGSSASAFQQQQGNVASAKADSEILRGFAQLPHEEQRKILLAAAKAKRRMLQELHDKALPVAVRNVRRLEKYWKRETLRREGKGRAVVREQRQALRSFEPQVSSGAVFVGLIPENALMLHYVDDWETIEAIRTERKLDLLLRREVAEWEPEAFSRAAEIARQYAESGFQGNLGIVLGIADHEDSEDLMVLENLAEELHVEHPGFRVSFLFSFKEALERRTTERDRPIPSLSGWFMAWAADPVPGLMHTLPGVALPWELWGWFEGQMRTQTALGEAA